MALRARDIRKAQAADLHPRLLWLRLLRGRISRLRLRMKRSFRLTDADRLTRALAGVTRAGDWPAALEIVSEWAKKAETSNDRALLERAGNDMRRLGQARRSFELIARSKAEPGPKEWDGSGLKDKSLVIERREGDFAIFFLYVSVIELAVRHCARCTVLVEPRLVTLFQRTFPDAIIRAEAERDAAIEAADWVSTFESVAFHLGWSGHQATTLKADPATTRAFRSTYMAACRGPLVGISWGSVNKYKNAPGLRDWVGLISATKATFVSLQYGNIASVMNSFERAVPGRVIADASVDQMTDMERFAAQIASLDAVVTISNTVAHVAGALGVPTVVLLDGQFKRTWPATGRQVDWYPKALLLRKSKGSWAGAAREAVQELKALCPPGGA